MSNLRTRGTSGAVRSGAALILLLLAVGCRAKDKARDSRLYDKLSRKAHLHSQPPPVPGKMAEVGRESITTECEHESYANARKGLIVGETGLHEDVFALRDRVSFAANAYSVDETLRLEALLRAEATVTTHSAEQADCINEFANHLQTLTDALIQADNLQKELDVSAFNNSRKQAEEQLEKKQREIDPSDAPYLR